MPHRRRQHDRSTLPRHGRAWTAVVGVAIAAVLVGSGAGRASEACTIAWDAGAGTVRWSDAANWTGNRLPAAADQVCIDEGFAVTLGSPDAHVAGVDVAGALTLDGGLELLGPGASEVSGSLTIADGRLQLHGDVPIATLRQTGGILFGTGSIVTADFRWSGGRQQGEGAVEVRPGGAGLVVDGAAHRLDDTRVLKIDPGAEASWTGGNLELRADAHVENSGVLEIRGDQDLIGCCTNAPQVVNTEQGVIRRTEGDGTIQLAYPFANDGAFELRTGTLAIEGGSVPGHASGGSLDVADGATLQFGARDTGFAAGSSVTTHGAGRILITGGQARFAGAVDAALEIDGPAAFGFFESPVTLQHVRLARGVLSGEGRVSTADFDWAGGEQTGVGTTRIEPGGPGLTLASDASRELVQRSVEIAPGAAAAWSAGGLTMVDRAHIENEGLLDVQGDLGIDTLSEPSTIHNAAGGVLRKSAGGGRSVLGAGVRNDGTIEAAAGTLDLGGGLENLSGDRLDGGRYVVTRTLAVAGARVFENAADVELDGPAARFEDSAGADALRDLAHNSGTLALSGGRELGTSGHLANAGTVTLAGGAALAPAGEYVQPAGTTQLAGSGATLRPGAQARVEGGLLRGAGTVDGTLVNNATADPGLATLEVTGDYLQGGAGTLAATIAGRDDHTLLDVRGHAELGGTLALATSGGFLPESGDEFELVRHASEDGEFDAVEGLEPEPGHAFSPPDYDPRGVWLRPGTVPRVSVGDATVAEGDDGDVTATFGVTVDPTPTRRVRVDWSTANGSAVAPGDYEPASGTVTIPHGRASAEIQVPVHGDTADEADETFAVALRDPQNATLGRAGGSGTILDDDEPDTPDPPDPPDRPDPPDAPDPPSRPRPPHRPPATGPRRCVDRKAPRSRLLKGRRGVRFKHRKLRLRGTARDRGCAGLRRVVVSVALRKRHHRLCRFLKRNGRLTKRRKSCRHPRWITVRGKRSWRLRTRHRLPRGHYSIRVQGIDRASNRELKLRRANFRRVRLRGGASRRARPDRRPSR
jgi:Calx-beta domain